MKDKARVAFHTVALIHHVYVGKYCEDFTSAPGYTEPEVLQIQHHGRRYFTMWNLVMQILYLTLALIHDLYQNHSKCIKTIDNKLQLWKGYLFTALVFPSTMFVSCMFWSVYSINREWVLPKVVDAYIPKWVNQSLHTNVMIFIAIELFVFRQKFYIPSFKSAFWGMSIVCVIYNALFFYTYFESGKWIYGVFKVLSWPERILLAFLSNLICLVALKGGILLQMWLHGEIERNRSMNKVR